MAEHEVRNKINVTVEVKKSIGNYENVTVSASHTFTLADDATDEDFYNAQGQAYKNIAAGLEAQIAEAVKTFSAPPAIPDDVNRALDEAAARPPQPASFPKPVNPPQAKAAQTIPVAGQSSEGRKLNAAPKAPDRQPGDWWVVKCDSYKWAGSSLEFWREGMKYPDASMNDKSPAWPTGWLEYMERDGEHHLFKTWVAVTCRVSDKKNEKGNYYVNVTDLLNTGESTDPGSETEF